jgi:hypothetical protein
MAGHVEHQSINVHGFALGLRFLQAGDRLHHRLDLIENAALRAGVAKTDIGCKFTCTITALVYAIYIRVA